ncbi:LIM/homeobox protein Lhx9-like [Pomacea canaliculata]|uniref:LIM/homeobox protein Lhx9-like n=1 Tax=Pomacea canaliculata TaxID=400727 RepID=UPI000D7262FD|nr:LIM/homeobox protein Lhx9-like [Pomacea canaliculata]
MSPRGQQCERGMVENAAMGPVTLAASDGDITDIGGRSSVPFDRQCVSHRRGPPLMGGGASGDEQPPGVCAGCGRRIVDRYYLQAVDKQWHVQCLTCSDCHYRLDSELTCFARDGQIYCKEDYYRRFAMKRCSRCHQGISANELVMRARDQVFHLMCFSCTACHRTLTPGEEFGLRDNQVYCRTDYELMFQGDYIPSLSPGIGGPAGLSTHSPNPNGPIPFYNGVGAVQKGRPRKRKSPLPDGDGCTNMGLNGLDMSDRPGDVLEREGYGHTPPRQKRVRTSFKHHQLRTMKSYFALNHNPDAKDLKQLAQKTGLSKRVLQVWFQNARAKYRRNLLKQQQDADKNGQGAASSPTGGDTNKEREKDASGSLTDLSNTRSPALSDISSTPSLSDLQSGAMESGGEQGSSSSISELFSSTIASIN